MAEEIEKLVVTIESDVSKLLAQTAKGVDQAEDELKKLEKTGDNAFKKIGNSAKRAFAGIGQSVKRFADASKRAFSQAAAGAKKLVSSFSNLQTVASGFIAILAAQRVVGFFRDIIGESVKLTKIQVTAERQLETVLRSTGGAAGLTAEELKKMASELQNVTNFGDEATIAGQSILLTFTNIGKDVFPRATKAMLDVSVAMKQGMKESAIQLGKALNDPIAGLGALRRVGIQFSESQEDQIKTMVKAGEITKAQMIILEELERQFGGSAEAAREADGGMIAFSNTVGDLQELFGAEFLESFTDQFGRLNDLLANEQAADALQELASALGEASARLTELAASGIIDTLEEVDPANVEKLAKALKDMAAAISEFLRQDVNADINGLIQTMTVLFDTITSITNVFNRARDVIEPVSSAVNVFRDVILQVIAPVLNLISAIDELNDLVAEITGKEIVDFSRDLAEASQTEGQAAEELAEKLEDLEGKRRDVADSAAPVIESSQEIVEAFEAEKAALDSLGSDFIDLQEDTNEKLQELNEDHVKKVEEINSKHQDKLIEIAADAGRKRIEAQKKADDALRDLAEDTARRRAEILDNARLELQKLEADTDRQLEDERENFEIKELRETEDHLQELRRLRNRFIDDLETAAKNRDARAIVDLRRRFQREQQESQTGFQTQQQRERQDQDQRLAEIREAEQVRAAEIIAARERDLQALIEAEAQKREEISRTLDEELVKIDEQEAIKVEKENKAFEERVAREEEQFSKRKEGLETALQDRLEAEAKALADQEEITEEGARAILEALNKTFGIGGNIDQLMEDFANRRRQKFKISVEFEESVSEGPATGPTAGGPTAPGSTPVPSFAEGGTLIARKPTLAMFGEAGPEVASFMPLGQMQRNVTTRRNEQRLEVDLNFRGSAPPGIRGAERDQIAGIVVQALRQAGAMRG